MQRSSLADRTVRINYTIELLSRMGVNDSVRNLIDRYNLSRRQAYRYIETAQACPTPLPLPVEKRVFTVKLPSSLISAVRARARSTGNSLSGLVAEALISFLGNGHQGGKETM